jgi:taurine dioxygenase
MMPQIAPLAGALGAEFLGVNLKTLDDDSTWKEIQRAFLEHAVLVFRDQDLSPADLMRVGGKFGEPCHYPFVTGMEGYPYIFEVVKEPEEKRNFGGAWHSDTTYLEQPPLATLLHAVEVPSHGGDTLFASTCAAYDALSEGMRKVVDTLIGVNSAELKYGGGRTAMHRKIGSMKVHDTESADQYVSEHPVARTHPDTGRKALYASRGHTTHFRGMTEEESAPLLNFLAQHQTRPEFTCRVRWAPGTLTIWDNRCTQHNAVNDYHGQRRRMRRLTVGAQTPR